MTATEIALRDSRFRLLAAIEVAIHDLAVAETGGNRRNLQPIRDALVAAWAAEHRADA